MGRLTVTAATSHPDHEILVRFGRGLLPAAESQAVEAHVATCDACTGQLTALDPDSLAQLLLQVPQLAACPDSTPLPPALEGRTSIFSPLSFPVQGTPAGDGPGAIPEPLREHPRYRVIRLLGRGGMGNVYLAEHRHMDRMVALKVIDPSILDNPAAVRRFRQEVKAAAQLSHPNIVQAHDAEEAGGLHFLVLEYVEGQQLAAYAAKAGPLPYQEACEYARQAALALQYAHGAGLVHRDVKPHNLMVTPDGRVKVLDFGLARVLARPGAVGASATQAGSLMGTPDYVAPEQARDAGAVDGRADVYSLGCTLYHLLTGRPPFSGGTAIEKVARHLTERVPALDAARLDLPAGLAEVVARMTARDPEQRYQTAGEVAEALAPFATAAVTAVPLAQPVRSGRTGTLIEAGLAREPAGALSQTAVLPPNGRRSGRERWWRQLIALAAGLLFVAAVAGFVVYRIQTDKGELVIETTDDEVEVVVKTGGEVVRIIDTKTDKSVTLRLRSGEYELETKGGEGLRLGVGKVTLKRDDRVIAKIERVPPNDGNQVKRVVNAEKPTKIQVFDSGHIGSIENLSPNYDLMLTATGKELRLWDVATGKELRRFNVGTPRHPAILSPDGKKVASWTWWPDSQVRIWDVESGKLVRSFWHGVIREGFGRYGYPTGVAFSPDGKTVFSSGEDGTVRQWDWEKGTEVKRFHDSPLCYGVAVSRDGRYVASSGSGIVVWEVESGKIIRRFEGHTTKGKEGVLAHGMQFLPDGSGLLSVGFDRTVRLWDIRTGKEVRRFEEKTHLFRSIGVSPDGRYLRSSGEDRTVRLWDLETGKELQRFTDPSHGVLSCSVSPDGRFATFGVIDNVVHLWRLPDPPVARDKR
jgi:WD40 repeat protein